MKPMLWVLATVGLLTGLLVVGALVFAIAVMPEPAPAPAPAAAAVEEVNPFQKWAPQPQPPQAAPAAAAGCPAGFVDQGGLCVGQEAVNYQADLQRRRDIEQLADELADELRAD